MEINLNVTVLEKFLSKVLEDAYGGLEMYLVIEELRVQTEDTYEDGSSDYFITGRYGLEGKWDRSIDLLVESSWNMTFLSGYFACYVDRQDMNYEQGKND